jgi:hypothetical protein
MEPIQPLLYKDLEVYNRLRAFNLLWRKGWDAAVESYPHQARFLFLNRNKTFEEMLRACFDTPQSPPVSRN